ncbi:MAG: GldG family protein, partial [bacterium]
MGKKFRYGTTSILDILLIAGILVLVNIYSIGSFRRIDLTENKEYTISNSTKNILSQLDDIVNIKFFVSEELPPEFLSLDRQIRDMMSEFEAYSNENFRLRYIDPSKEPRYKQEAEMAGIPEVTFEVRKEDKIQMMRAYLGMLIEHENKTEAIPFVRSVETLEYDLMSRIVKVLQKESDLPTIGILQGHGEPGTQQPDQQQQQPPGEMAVFMEKIREQYNAMDIQLENRDKIPSTVDTLIIVNPGSIPDSELWAIDQFVMGGGKLICMVNGVGGVDNLNEPPQKFISGISDLLSNCGVKVNNDLVLDRRSEMATFRTGQFSRIQKQYPFWINVQKDGFDPGHPITSSLESATFHWPSSIEILKDKLEAVTAVELVTSSDQSWLMKKDYSTNPMQDFNALPTGDRYLLGVALKGNFSSYFSGKDRPVKASDGSPVGAGEALIEKSTETEIIVFSTGQIALNHVWDPRQGSPGVQNMLLNTLDYLNIGEELIGIRSRQATNRPLNPDMFDDDKEKNLIKALIYLAVPFFVALFGII